MSEFSSGFITLSKVKNILEEKLKSFPHKYIIEQSNNNKWVYFFIESPYARELESFKEIYTLSSLFPILYFINAEDHGWEYKLFNKEKLVAEMAIDYEFLFYMTWEIAEKRYPEIDSFKLLSSNEWKEVKIEMQNSEKYSFKINDGIKNKNINEFKVFSLNNEIINNLEILLTFENIASGEKIRDLVDEFKNLLEINDFEWISYEYLKNSS